MLKELDPHSSYLTKEEVEQLNEPLQGNFEGIGVSFNILNDTVYIISPLQEALRIKREYYAGDRIIKVDGNNVAGIGITIRTGIRHAEREKGNQSQPYLFKGEEIPDLIDFEIIRDKIPIYSIDASYKVSDDIGYIKINRFSMTTMDEFTEAMAKAQG